MCVTIFPHAATLEAASPTSFCALFSCIMPFPCDFAVKMVTFKEVGLVGVWEFSLALRGGPAALDAWSKASRAASADAAWWTSL